MEDNGMIDLLFSDETGFNLVPNIPYGWQPIGEQITIRSAKDHVCNLLGFLTRNGSLKVWSTPHNINSDFVIECIDELADQTERPTVIVLDNAPWHASAKVINKEKEWNEKDLYLFFLPTYSPHLNLIETLWRKIKYEWLKAEDYLSANKLKEALYNIINKYDDEFSINISMNFFA
jgi:transposase